MSRPISVQTGVVPHARGSARVRLCATDVIAVIKDELGKPAPLLPDKEKKNSICVECSSTTAPVLEGRGGEELSAELSAGLRRCLLGGKSGSGAGIDLTSLLVVEGKVCCDLYIDGLVISSDGNLLDALAVDVKVALSNTCIPKVSVSFADSSDDLPEVDLSDEKFVQFDTFGVSVVVTLTKIRRVIHDMRAFLIMIAAVMLLLAILGFVLSSLGHKHAIYIFIISRWLLVAVALVYVELLLS